MTSNTPDKPDGRHVWVFNDVGEARCVACNVTRKAVNPSDLDVGGCPGTPRSLSPAEALLETAKPFVEDFKAKIDHQKQSDCFGVAILPDSGKRIEYGTGAVRDITVGKGRFDLLSPYALQRIAQHYENGANKYADRNWEKGIPLARFLDSAIRHTMQILAGDEAEDHAAAACWNLMGYIHTLEMIRKGRLGRSLSETMPFDPLPTQKWEPSYRKSELKSFEKEST